MNENNAQHNESFWQWKRKEGYDKLDHQMTEQINHRKDLTMRIGRLKPDAKVLTQKKGCPGIRMCQTTG